MIDFFGNRPIVINAIQRADSKHAKGHTEEAIAILMDAVRQAPSEKELVLRLADILIESKSFQKAEELLAALPDGTDSKIFSLKGICADGCGDEEKALKFSEIAISLDPSNAAALCLMGGIAYRNGHQEEAKEFFLRAIETQPGYGEAYIHLGAMKWDAGYHEESVSYFERGFILCPHSQEIAIAYHKIIAETKNFERAERVFREAASLNPNNRKIAFLYIAILIQAEKFKTAMSEIESAMERFGFDDGMLVAASRIRERIGPIEIQPRAKGATLSLCIIARNEEANMASCLMSVKGLADEIIVADTGSTDRTKTIATILGAKVFDWPWQGNFAEARNSSISRANGEWVLILDPDERLSESDHAAIKQLINDRGAKRIAYRLTTRNYTDEAGVNGWVSNDGAYPALEAGKGWFPSVKVRLFPRLPSVQFVHPVHELVEPSLQRAGFRIHECEVPVHHFGKIDRNRVIEKGKEYYRIGMQKLEQLKGDPHALKELAVQASEIGEYDHALRVWKQLIQQNPDDASAFMNAGYAHLMLRQFKQARDYSMRALELSPRFNEAAINLAAAELMAGNVDIASRLIEELLSRSPDYPPALGRMAVIRMLQGRRKDGLACIERLRGMGFDCTGAMSDQARDLMSVGRFDEALIIVEAAAESGMQSDTILALLDECRRRLSATSDIDGHESASRRRVCAMDPVEVSEHVSASL